MALESVVNVQPMGKVLIGDVSIDASVSENHSLQAEITQHKVEQGADITDHFRTLPKSISIEGKISNASLGPTSISGDIIDSDKAVESGNKTPVFEAWKRFKQMFNKNEVVTIVTSLETYTSMGLTSIKVVRSSANADTLTFSATAKEIRFATAEYTDKVKVPKTKRGQKEKDKSRQTTENLVPEYLRVKDEKTILWEMTNSAGIS